MNESASPQAYRRSNTLRYLPKDSTVCGHTLESLIKERRRCKDSFGSQSLRQKDREKTSHLFVIVKVDNAGFQSCYFGMPAFLYLTFSGGGR